MNLKVSHHTATKESDRIIQIGITPTESNNKNDFYRIKHLGMTTTEL